MQNEGLECMDCNGSCKVGTCKVSNLNERAFIVRSEREVNDFKGAVYLGQCIQVLKRNKLSLQHILKVVAHQLLT